MPTLAQIRDASKTLDAETQSHLASLIRNSARYQGDVGLYGNVAATIAAANGTVKAQQLNAALLIVDGVGEDFIGLSGGSEGVDYSDTRKRENLIDYIIDTLYESQLSASSVQVGRITGSRAACGICGCSPCSSFCRSW